MMKGLHCSKTISITRLCLCAFLWSSTLVVGADHMHRCPAHLDRNILLHTHQEQCYQFIFEQKKWCAARDYCHQQGGHLITIESRETQEFVKERLTNVPFGGNRIWIGANDMASEQKWTWVTGQNVSGYSNWEEGEPSCHHYEEHCREDCACMLIDKEYKWYPTFCEANAHEYGFICQYEIQQEATTPAAPADIDEDVTVTSTSSSSANTSPEMQAETTPNAVAPDIEEKVSVTHRSQRPPYSTATPLDGASKKTVVAHACEDHQAWKVTAILAILCLCVVTLLHVIRCFYKRTNGLTLDFEDMHCIPVECAKMITHTKDTNHQRIHKADKRSCPRGIRRENQQL